MNALRVSSWFVVILQAIMKPFWSTRLRYEIVIGEKGLAVLKTDCPEANQGVGFIACSAIIDTNLRWLAEVENVERNGEF